MSINYAFHQRDGYGAQRFPGERREGAAFLQLIL